MIYFEVRDKDTQEVLASNVKSCPYKDEFELEKNKTDRSRSIKSRYEIFDTVSVWLIVQGEDDLVKSNQYFNFLLRAYSDTGSLFWEYYQKKIEALSHTLITVQGQMKQKMEGVIAPQDFKGQTFAISLEKIIKIVQSNPDTVADLLYFLNKKIFDIEACLEGFHVAHLGLEPKGFLMLSVNIKKVLLNIVDSFIASLNKRQIFVNLHNINDDYAEENRILIDYKTFDLAMHNFFHNIEKYAKHDSRVDVFFEKFEGDGFKLEFTMMSCRIEKSEIEAIFDEGFTGMNSTEPGNGIGMYVIRKALLLNGVKIHVNPVYAESLQDLEGKYVRNNFLLVRDK